MSEAAAPGTSAAVTLYGIPNCDSVKKARAWLSDHGIEYAFHDFKKDGLTSALTARWLKAIDWTLLVNRKGTTWRGLPDERRAAVTDAAQAAVLMLEAPSIVKRPVLECAGHTLVGFDADQYQTLFHSL